MPIRSVLSASALAAIVALVAVAPASAVTRVAVAPAVLDVAGPLGGAGAVEIRVENRGTDGTTLGSSLEELNTAEGLPSATAWSTVRPQRLELEPGEAGTFHLDLDIPDETDPGGHYTAISITTISAGSDADAPQAAVSGRIVVPVLITVTGDEERPTPPALPAVDRTAVFLQTDGEYVTRTEVRNDGKTHIALDGDVAIERVTADGTLQPVMSSAVSVGRVLPRRVRPYFANTGTSLVPDQTYKATIRLAPPARGRRTTEHGFTETIRFASTPQVDLQDLVICAAEDGTLQSSIVLANSGSVGVAPDVTFRATSPDGAVHSVSQPSAQHLAWPNELTVISSTMRAPTNPGEYELTTEVTVGDETLLETTTIQTGDGGTVPTCPPPADAGD